MGMRENLEEMLAKGQDNPTLRFTLGDLYLHEGDAARASTHLAEAIRQNPDYSAAWKLYGKVLDQAGHRTEAITAYEHGIEVAERKGDLQAAKEMQVFLRRLRRPQNQD